MRSRRRACFCILKRKSSEEKRGGRWGAQGRIGKGSAGQKKGLFKTRVNVFILSLLPGISQIRTFLKVYGAELRLLLKKNNTYHHHHLWQPRALALNTPFLLLLHSPPALSPRAVKIPHPVSLSLSDAPEGHVSSVEVQ